MKIAVVGTGYVGLVTGTCLAECGNDVTCVDKDAAKVEMLRAGSIPIYEPGLAEMVTPQLRGRSAPVHHRPGRGDRRRRTGLHRRRHAPGQDGGADLSGVWAVGREIAEHLTSPKIVVIKSTVPVGTNAELARRMAEVTDVPFDVASNPEFLKEGAAIDDFNKPDRVVVGVRRREVGERLRELYAPFLGTDRPFLAMTPESAEMTKYVANCLLATKISFINEMANLCDGLRRRHRRRPPGDRVRPADRLQLPSPGLGYGGSCFPKDIRRGDPHGQGGRHPAVDDGGRRPATRPRSISLAG